MSFRPTHFVDGRAAPYGVVGNGMGGVSAVAACGGGAPPGGNGRAELAPPPPPYPPPPEPDGWSRMAVTWMRGGVLIAQGIGWARWQWIAGSDHWTLLFVQDP